MNKITINKDNIVKKINTGIESKIYLYNDNGELKVLKLFEEIINFTKHNHSFYLSNDFGRTDNQIFFIDEKVLRNKEKKLEILSKEPCMKNELQLLDLVYDKDGKFIGYTSKPDTEITFENEIHKSKRTRINNLYLLKEKIESLNPNGIYIGDFNNPMNFGVRNNKEIMLFDIDSYYVKGLDFDYKNDFIKDYLRNNDKIDNIDNYCFNLFTIAYYEKTLMPFVMANLRDLGLPYKFDTKENRELLHNMIKTKNYKKGYFLDNMKKGLF